MRIRRSNSRAASGEPSKPHPNGRWPVCDRWGGIDLGTVRGSIDSAPVEFRFARQICGRVTLRARRPRGQRALRGLNSIRLGSEPSDSLAMGIVARNRRCSQGNRMSVRAAGELCRFRRHPHISKHLCRDLERPDPCCMVVDHAGEHKFVGPIGVNESGKLFPDLRGCPDRGHR